MNSRNEGVHHLADFTDRAIPLGPASPVPDPLAKASRSANAGVYPLAVFTEPAQPLSQAPPDSSRATAPVNGDAVADPSPLALVVQLIEQIDRSAFVQQPLIAQIKTMLEAAKASLQGSAPS